MKKCVSRRRRRWNNTTPTSVAWWWWWWWCRWWLLRTLVVVSVVYAKDENEDLKWESDDGENLSWDDRIVFAILSWIMGFVISFFGTAWGYVAWKDYKIMETYEKKGVVVHGTIVSYERIREDRPRRRVVDDDEPSHAEFVVFVDYDRRKSDGDENDDDSRMDARIRKKFRVNSRDVKQKDPTDCPLVELYVLPDRPLSGLPKSQVERALSDRGRRTLTMALVFAVFSFASLCAEAARRSMRGDDDDDENDESHHADFWRIGPILTMIMVFFQLSVMTFCFDEGLTKLVEDEYFRSGEYLELKGDDDSSSLSSGDDEVLMNVSKHSRLL